MANKLVPVEPTDAMIEAAHEHHEGSAYLPYSLYRSMLAASPAQEAGKQEPPRVPSVVMTAIHAQGELPDLPSPVRHAPDPGFICSAIYAYTAEQMREYARAAVALAAPAGEPLTNDEINALWEGESLTAVQRVLRRVIVRKAIAALEQRK